MPSIEEMLGSEEAPKIEMSENAQHVEKASIDFSGILNIFKAQSIDKPIEEYQEHVLNFDKKKSTGRIIRGFEGLLGALNFAIIDVIMGFYEKSREKKGGE